MLRELCLGRLNSLPCSSPLFFTLHSSSSSLLPSHPPEEPFSRLFDVASPLSTFLKCRFIPLRCSLSGTLFHLSPPLPFCFLSLSPPVLTQTFTHGAHKFKGMPGMRTLLAASCCCYTYDCDPQNPRSVSVFPEPMDGRMDGCRRRMIDEQVGQC